MKHIFGGLNGYSAGNVISTRNAPLLYGGLSYKETSTTIVMNHAFFCDEIIEFCEIHGEKLTGQIRPDQIKIFRSSTSISLNDFKPEALISASSCENK